MKAQLTAKYLQFLSKKNKNQNAGFTLIELLVVIIIIGILSAIALPSFLNQSAKARASEARTNVGAMNRAQQTYYLENQKFAVKEGGETGIDKLGVGIKDTGNYAYEATSDTATTSVINRAKSKNKDLKGHVGGVFSVNNQTPSVLCEAKVAADETAEKAKVIGEPKLNKDNDPTCDEKTSKPVGG